jgi:hypothetical protein
MFRLFTQENVPNHTKNKNAQAAQPRRLALLETEHSRLKTSRYRIKGVIANTQLTEKLNQENHKNGTLADW